MNKLKNKLLLCIITILILSLTIFGFTQENPSDNDEDNSTEESIDNALEEESLEDAIKEDVEDSTEATETIESTADENVDATVISGDEESTESTEPVTTEATESTENNENVEKKTEEKISFEIGKEASYSFLYAKKMPKAEKGKKASNNKLSGREIKYLSYDLLPSIRNIFQGVKVSKVSSDLAITSTRDTKTIEKAENLLKSQDKSLGMEINIDQSTKDSIYLVNITGNFTDITKFMSEKLNMGFEKD